MCMCVCVSAEGVAVALQLDHIRYRRRCELASRGDAQNFPLGRSCEKQHWKHVAAMSKQAFADDIQSLKDVCGIGLAEDVCGDYKILRARFVFNDLSVKTRLLDIALSPEKHAVKKLEQLTASILASVNGDERAAADLRNKVKAGLKGRSRWGFLPLPKIETAGVLLRWRAGGTRSRQHRENEATIASNSVAMCFTQRSEKPRDSPENRQQGRGLGAGTGHAVFRAQPAWLTGPSSVKQHQTAVPLLRCGESRSRRAVRARDPGPQCEH